MSRARGYTLLELLIVGALIAVLVGFAMPAMRRPLARSQLRDAAAGLRIALAKTRLEAIESGTIWTFRYQPGTGRFVISPQAELTEEDDSGIGAGLAGNDAMEAASNELDNARFSRSTALPSSLTGRDGTGKRPCCGDGAGAGRRGRFPGRPRMVRPVFFYPTGRTSSAQFRARPVRRIYRRDTAALTGSAKVGKLQTPRPACRGAAIRPCVRSDSRDPSAVSR